MEGRKGLGLTGMFWGFRVCKVEGFGEPDGLEWKAAAWDAGQFGMLGLGFRMWDVG